MFAAALLNAGLCSATHGAIVDELALVSLGAERLRMVMEAGVAMRG